MQIENISYKNIDFSQSKKIDDSASGVCSCRSIINNKETEGYYTPISDKYPAVLARNELLMLADYSLVLGKDKVAIKHPVVNEKNELIGTFSPKIDDFQTMCNSNLTAEKLLAAGFIATLFACYIRMENDLHPGNITTEAKLFDADKSNYPYISQYIGKRYAEILLMLNTDFPLSVTMLEGFPHVQAGPCYWATFANVITGKVSRIFANHQEFINLIGMPETIEALYLAIIKEFLVTDDREFIYNKFDPQIFPEGEPYKYIQIFTERIKILKKLILSTEPLSEEQKNNGQPSNEQFRESLFDFICENKNNIAKFKPASSDTSDALLEKRYAILQFEFGAPKLAKHIKQLIDFANLQTDENIKENILKIYKEIINNLADYLNSDFTTPALDFIKGQISKLKNIFTDLSLDEERDKYISDFIRDLKVFTKKSSFKNNSDDNPQDSISPSSFYWISSSPEKLQTLKQKNKQESSFGIVSIEKAIAEGFIAWLAPHNGTYPQRLELLTAIENGYAQYSGRSTKQASDLLQTVTFGFFTPLAENRIDTLSPSIAKHITGQSFVETFIDDLQQYSFGYNTLNNCIIEAIFTFIKEELIHLNAISLTAKYPLLSDFTQEAIESYDIRTNAKLIFEDVRKLLSSTAENTSINTSTYERQHLSCL